MTKSILVPVVILMVGVGLAEAQPGAGYPPTPWGWGPPPVQQWGPPVQQWGPPAQQWGPPAYMAPDPRYGYPPSPYMPTLPPNYPVYPPITQQDSLPTIETTVEPAPASPGGRGSNFNQDAGVPSPIPAPPAAKDAAPASAPPSGSPAEVGHGPILSELPCLEKKLCSRGWVVPEYLFWFIKPGPSTVPLITTGSPTGAPPGALGQPGTTVLSGGSNVNFPGANGFRATFGWWIDPNSKFGVEASGFILENATVNFVAASNGNTILTVPVFNSTKGTEGGFLIAGPGFGPGTVASSFTSQLYGGEVSGIYSLIRSGAFEIEALGGFRYLSLQESFNLSASYNYSPTTAILQSDSFQASNQFLGAQLGLRMKYQYGSLFGEATLKGAFGTNLESLNVTGSTVARDFTTPQFNGTFPGGFFAQSSNMGRQNMTAPFSAIPQLTVKLGWEVAPNIRLFAGYDFLYWFNVIRPGSQVDRNVNENQSILQVFSGVVATQSTQGPPFRMFNTSNYYAQGITLGIEFRY